MQVRWKYWQSLKLSLLYISCGWQINNCVFSIFKYMTLFWNVKGMEEVNFTNIFFKKSLYTNVCRCFGGVCMRTQLEPLPLHLQLKKNLPFPPLPPRDCSSIWRAPVPGPRHTVASQERRGREEEGVGASLYYLIIINICPCWVFNQKNPSKTTKITSIKHQ